MYQCFLYLKDPNNPEDPDSNHYAIPLPISPVISSEHQKVIRIDILPTGKETHATEAKPYQPRPPSEYVPEYQNLRTDLKPLNVVQPDGASFKVTEEQGINIVEWQKWYMRIGFNQREGMVLYDVRLSLIIVLSTTHTH
jgi:primary-amine oxidase